MFINQVREILKQHEQDLKAYGVKKIAIFGSVLRQDDKFDSDIDIELNDLEFMFDVIDNFEMHGKYYDDTATWNRCDKH